MNASHKASLVNRHIRRFTGRYIKQSCIFIDVCGLHPSTNEVCIFATFFGASGLFAHVECMEPLTPKTFLL